MRYKLVVMVLLLVAMACAVIGATVTVAWDPSPDGTVTGYKLYYGVGVRSYTNQLDVGSALQATDTNMTVGQTYHFAATAYNALGTESVFSDELTYTVSAQKPKTPIIQIKP
jgi:hypothetical protein